MKKIPRLSILLLLLPALALAAYIAMALRLLGNAGEYMPASAALARIEDTFGLYAPPRPANAAVFRRALYARRQPAAAAIGSPRISAFHDTRFAVPFANLAGAAGLAETDMLAHELFAQAAPRVVIVGLDPGWFDTKVRPPAPPAPAEPRFSPADLLKPLSLLLSGRLDGRDLRLLWSGDTPNAGLDAILKQKGYDRSGAWRDTGLLSGLAQSGDARFSATLEKVESGAAPFGRNGAPDGQRLHQLGALLSFLKEQGAAPLLLFPPVAPPVLDAMDAQGAAYAHIDAIAKAVGEIAKQHRAGFFDFRDARGLGASPCEFVDGLTGGETVHDRMLLAMAVESPALRDAARLPDIAWNIRAFAGRASALAGEVDFLDLGCDKTRNQDG